MARLGILTFYIAVLQRSRGNGDNLGDNLAIISIFLYENKYFDHSLEPSRRDGSNEWVKTCFVLFCFCFVFFFAGMKNYLRIIDKKKLPQN